MTRSARRGARAGPALAFAFCVHALVSAASARPADGPASADAATKAEAVAHFDRGLALFDAGAWAPALAEFLEARRIFPLRNALYQAGLCLEKLQRYDDALDEFEATLRELDGGTPPLVRENVQRKVLAMRRLVGEIVVVETEPGARVTVDGIARGEHPLLAPLWVAAGEHLVRVWKEGFVPFEKRVVVAGGKRERVAAELRPLGPSGRVRVAEQGGEKVRVLVDGADVGGAPWEGLLSPGPHVVALQGEGRVGTPPIQVEVVRDRTTLVTLAAEALTAALRVEPIPVHAGLAIDGVSVGHGVWEGRVRAGAHRIEATADGFLPSSELVSVGVDQRRVVRVELGRDPRSPFAPRRGHFAIEALAGPAVAPIAGGDVANACSGACSKRPAIGGLAVVRAGYELASGFGIGITGGYLGALQTVRRRGASITAVGHTAPEVITLDESLWARAGLAGVWIGFALGAPWRARFRLGAGALFGAASDDRAGSSASGRLEPTGERWPMRGAYVAPQLGVGFVVSRRIEVELGLEMLVGVLPSPPRWSATHDVVLDRAAGVRELGTFPTQSFAGTLLTIAPSLGIRYEL
jgi:hypothetical protein